ncbi:MAG: hypothetical protein M3R04_10865 [bacterium]|nr:hypothetical protein [bacterium]
MPSDSAPDETVGAAHARPATALPKRKRHHLMAERYSEPGSYFVTICTKDRKHLLGEVDEQVCKLSWIGEVVNRCWLGVPAHLPNVSLDCYSIMPNHFHALIWLNILSPPAYLAATHSLQALAGRACAAPTVLTPTLESNPARLPKVMNSFKSAVTREVNKRRSSPGETLWLDDYYDRVVRTEEELHEVRKYILENPLAWHYDRENSERIVNAPMSKWEPVQ